MDTKTQDLKAEGRMYDPWALWRWTVDHVEQTCEYEHRSMNDEELDILNRLYFEAQRMEVITHA
jgi:hypothetical protein